MTISGGMLEPDPSISGGGGRSSGCLLFFLVVFLMAKHIPVQTKQMVGKTTAATMKGVLLL